MDKLPNDIINNILLIRYEEALKKIETHKKEIKQLNFRLDQTEMSNQNMLNFLETHEVKYCEECDCYGTDDEIIFYENFEMYLCEYCLEFKEEQIEDNN